MTTQTQQERIRKDKFNRWKRLEPSTSVEWHCKYCDMSIVTELEGISDDIVQGQSQIKCPGCSRETWFNGNFYVVGEVCADTIQICEWE